MSMATGEDSRLINWILDSRGAAFLEAKILDSLLVQPKCFFQMPVAQSMVSIQWNQAPKFRMISGPLVRLLLNPPEVS